MEPTVVSLRAVIGGIDVKRHGWFSFLDRRTGEVATLPAVAVAAAEDEDGGDYRGEHLEKAREIVDTDHFLLLPTRLDIHEWSIMRRFSETVEDPIQRYTLRDCIRGRGGSPRFRETIRRLGIEREWSDHWYRALEVIAVDWLEERGIPHTE